MIRSLLAPADVPLDDDFTPHRNYSPEKLEQALSDGMLLWIDMVDAEDDEIEWLEKTLQLHPSVVADLRREDRRPTLMVYPRYLFLSLFQPYTRQNQAEGKEVHCLIGRNYFVTVRRADAGAVDEAYNRVANNVSAWRQGNTYFLYLTAQHVVDAYYPLLDRISNQLNSLEETLMSDAPKTDEKHVRRPVYVTKQQLIALRQMVSPQREVLSAIVGEERINQNPDTRDLFRHLYERLLRIYDVIDSQRDLATNVLDMIETHESNKLVEIVNRLTLFSIIFLPLTFLTGLLQLNFVTTVEPIVLPLSGYSLLAALLAITLSLFVGFGYLFRRQGWI
ncbi:MAG: magnesium transporter CorA family protein [Anaerolineae bacterium]|nr:magnesium transporter CorA family protein [Anaerolineae bacterium]